MEQREILFRAWDTDFLRYVNSSEFNTISEYFAYCDRRRGPKLAHSYEGLKRDEQFTGLTDRNGVRIFEGDILLFPDYDPNHEDEYKGHGVLEQCDWGWHITNRNDVDMRDINGEDCEVIGNIHQNADLL